MSNEEKILSMLTKMQDDINTLKTEIESLRQNGIPQPEQKELTAQEQHDLIMEMANLLDDDEKDALGRYQTIEEARKNALFEHDTWILPANPNNYDVDAAFRKLGIIEWRQSRSLKNIKLGDFVYVYESNPVKAIRWKCRVVLVNAEISQIDDRCFWRTDKIVAGSFIWLESLREYDVVDAFSYDSLCKNGLKSTVRSPMKVTGDLLNYLETIDEMADRDERNKKFHQPAKT